MGLDDRDAAVIYTTVYLIERSLSLDNLFVFILLFAYFAVPYELRARLLFWGIVFALIMRGLAIAGGIALIEQFHFVVYVLGVLLILLAVRVWRGVEENVDPDRNLMVRLVRRFFPVTSDYHDHHWFVREGGVRYATPLLLCLAAIVFADIAFAMPKADVDDSVALAVLIRALVTTSMEMALAGDPGPRPSTELLRAAYWRAARDGWPGFGVARYRDGFFRPAYRRRGSSTTSALRWIATGTPTWWTSSCAASSCAAPAPTCSGLPRRGTVNSPAPSTTSFLTAQT